MLNPSPVLPDHNRRGTLFPEAVFGVYGDTFKAIIYYLHLYLDIMACNFIAECVENNDLSFSLLCHIEQVVVRVPEAGLEQPCSKREITTQMLKQYCRILLLISAELL